MSQQMTRPVNDSTGKSRQTAQSYQPVWMAHWVRTRSNTSADRCNHSARPEEKHDPVVNESLRTSLKSSGNKGTCISLMKHGQDINDTKESRPMFGNNIERGKAVDCKDGIHFLSKIPAANENELSLRGFRSIGEGTSNNPFEWLKPHSSTHIVPYYDNLEKYESDKGKATMCSLIDKPSIVSINQWPHANLRMLEQEHRHKQSQPEDTSINTCFRDFNTSLLFGHDWFTKMQQVSGIKFLPPQSIASEEDKSNNKSQFDFYSLKKYPNNSVRDLETMRICTTVDSVEATPRGCPMFSQTTHSLLIMKKANVNLSQENNVFRATRFVKKTNEHTSRDFTLSRFFGQGNRGVKLHPLSSSLKSEGRYNVRNVEDRKVTIKNESSAETDTMDGDFFKEEKLNSGANSTPSTKAFNIYANLSPPIPIAPSRGIERLWTNSRVPDINLELPALPAVESPPENVCPSSSRTESLEMDMLLANDEQTKTKSNINPDVLDPSNRWVKRLKVRSSSKSNSSSRGTKISNPTKNLSHDKMRKYFTSILDSGIASSEPSPRNTNLSGKNGELLKVGEEFTVDRGKKAKESLLSHIWIKRWLRNGSRVTDQKVGKVRESRDSRMSLDDDDDIQKKPFPSMGAMSLMGRAMGSLQSCEIQKRGSITLWNTKAFGKDFKAVGSIYK